MFVTVNILYKTLHPNKPANLWFTFAQNNFYT
jgi:hypothetical protein